MIGLCRFPHARDAVNGVKHLFDHRDFLNRGPDTVIEAPKTTVKRWRDTLSASTDLDEAQGIAHSVSSHELGGYAHFARP